MEAWKLHSGSSGKRLLKNFKQTSMLAIIICKEKLIANKWPLPVIDPVIGTLFPAWDSKQTWLLRNFVPENVFTSNQFLAYEKGQWLEVFQSRLCWDPALCKWVAPTWERMETMSTSNKCNNKFVKKLLQSSDLVHCLVPLFILSWLSYKQSLIHLKKIKVLFLHWSKVKFIFFNKFYNNYTVKCTVALLNYLKSMYSYHQTGGLLGPVFGIRLKNFYTSLNC